MRRVAVGLLLAAIGCGSSAASSGTCGKVSPCGGDLTGTWTLTGSCADLATQPALSCPDERIDSWTPTISGTWTFNADMTYTRSTTSSAVVVWSIPLSCISALASSCADFEAQAQAGLNPDQTITCTGTSTCLCTETAGPLNQSDNGTYQTSGTDITYTSAVDGTTGTSSYCVQGSTLHLVTLDARAASGIGADLIGEKR